MRKPITVIDLRNEDRSPKTPAKTRRKKSIPDDQQLPEDMTGVWGQEENAILDMFSLKNLYYSEPWVFILCNVIARKISRQLMRVMSQTITDGQITSKPNDGHDLTSIIKRPNDYEPYSVFMHKVAAELPLMGNAIIWKLRFHKQMVLLPTEICQLDFNGRGRLNGYRIMPSLAEELAEFSQFTLYIKPEDIIHIRLPNLKSMLWGLSPFIPGRKSVLFDRYSSEYLNTFYEKQAVPGMVLEMDSEANEMYAKRFLKSMELTYTGRRNQRRTMLLPKGVKSKEHAQTLADQRLLEHVKENRNTLRALFAVPPHELGLQETGSLGSNETSQQIKNFWDSTLIPYQDLIAGSIGLGYEEELGTDNALAFDNSNVVVLQENMKEKAELAEKMLATHTLNEVRKKVYNEAGLEGGDETPKQGQGGFGGAPQQFALGREERLALPAASEMPMDGEPMEEMPSEEETAKNRERLKAFIQKNQDFWDRKARAENVKVAGFESDVLDQTLKFFLACAPDAVRVFKRFAAQEGYTPGAWKGFGSVTPGLPDFMRLKADQKPLSPKEQRLQKRMDNAFQEHQEVWVDGNVPTIQASANLGYDSMLTVPYNLPNRTEIETLRLRNARNRNAMLQTRLLSSFQGISGTTSDEIMGVIAAGVEKAQTIQEISKSIESYFSDHAPKRAMTIARTETLTAVSMGQKAAMDDATEVNPKMKKMWVSAGDNRVRDSHIHLDGKVVDASKDFKRNLGYPRDTRAPADEVINCRCTLLFYPDDEEPDTEGVAWGVRLPK